ncbi:MAG: hypothetical protein NC453_24690 [Muribaculum sp.]|nr:hypothetical protein [Muribaculum sp.]
MNKPGLHRFEIYAGKKSAGNLKDTLTHSFSMFEAQKVACTIAVNQKCDVSHWAYNDALHKWDYLGTFHEDGTNTNAFGEVRRFTGNDDRRWAPIEEGGAK